VINHTQVSCGIEPIGSPTIIYEDNVACVAQMQSGYVKSNVTKHITPKLLYPHELQVSAEISILQIKLRNNLAYLFSKSLPYMTFSKCVASISMRRLRDLHELGGVSVCDNEFVRGWSRDRENDGNTRDTRILDRFRPPIG
jgi:hypothetical protein